jgi:peptidoglycan/xylan/chitin deacetylase (PgdA/CDA1 family)
MFASAVVLALLVVIGVTVAWSCSGPSDPGDVDTTAPATDATSETTLPGHSGSETPTSNAGTTSASDGASAPTTEKTTAPTAATSAINPTQTGSKAAAPIIKRGPKDKKWIALTFDDNYQGSNATKTIAVLTKYDVSATFFVIGHYVDLGPKLAKEIAAAGFEVGDHTRSHANCAKLSKRALRIEIGNGTDHYRELTGAPTVPLFRPPGGFVDRETCEVAAEKGFKYVVMWDVDTNDWRGRTAAQIIETVMGNAHNGAIILMHMAAKHTAEALPTIITRLRDAGYELVPLTKMLGV